jgi:hypothetical protein
MFREKTETVYFAGPQPDLYTQNDCCWVHCSRGLPYWVVPYALFARTMLLAEGEVMLCNSLFSINPDVIFN